MSNSIEEQFRADARANDLVFTGDIVIDGRVHRYHIEGDNPGKKNGWAVLHSDASGTNGTYGSWRTGQKFSWRLGGRSAPLSAEQRQRMREESNKRLAEKSKKAADAKARAQRMWKEAEKRPATADHPYLKNKGVQPHGLRLGTWIKRVENPDGSHQYVEIDNVLLVPLRNRNNEIQSLQGITAEGEKLFLPNGAKQGNFFAIGKPKIAEDGEKEYGFAEGYATAASAHEVSGQAVLCCFDVGNMEHLVREARSRQTKAHFTLYGDNDTKTAEKGRGNPGMEVAFKVGKECNAAVVVNEHGGDFNDLVQEHGAEAAKAAFAARVVPTEPYAPPKLGEADQAPGMPHPAREIADLQSAPSGQGLGRPVDIFNVLPPPPLPLDCFPFPIAAYAHDQAELLGCDPSIIAVSALVAAASMIHDGLQIQPKKNDYSWTESPRLWGAIVGDPSTMKSPAITKGMRHVRKANQSCAESNKASEADFARRFDEWKESCKRDGKGAHAQPERPPRKRRIVEDTTVEALADVLADNESGLLCFMDELTGWFGSMDAYKGGGKSAGKDRAHWLELYNGGPRQIDRVTRGCISVPNFSACVLGGIQPGPMRRIAKGIGDDGLLQRFMVVVARPAEAGQDRAPDAAAVRGFADLFAYLEAVQPGPKPVVLSEGAHVARGRVDSLALKLSKALDHPQLQAWLGKWSGLFARILLTVHVCECAALKVYPAAEPVSAATAERVEKLMCAGLLHHALHFYTELVDADDRHEHVRQLARLILARGWLTMARRDLATNWKASRSLKDWELQTVIGTLCTYGWLEPDADSIGHDGKPNRWAVNPLVHEDFATHGEIARARRRAAAAAIRELRDNYAAADDPAPQQA